MKIDRQAVYNKYGGHCAYCGRGITIKEMEVDHLHPRRIGGTDDMDNLMPSCHTCNHYKRASPLEEFRNWLLGELIDRLMKVYIFRVALKYDMITINGWDKKFYFEKKDMVARNLRRDKYCGECDKFLYEDINGYGLCDVIKEECCCCDLCHLTHGKP